MFATIVGTLPPPATGADADEALRVQLEAQVAAGIDLLSFAEPAPPDGAVVDAWQRAAAIAASLGQAPVKAAIVGPFTLAVELGAAEADLAARVRDVAAGLFAAGCPFVEIHEPSAVSLAADRAARRTFRSLHDQLVRDLEGVDGHLCLAITGGNADAAGAETILVPGYRSFLFDLILGPDNWRLAAAAPSTVGIVAAAIDHRPRVREVPETGIWAAHYAASTGGRGIERVGLATSGSLASLDWETALARLAVLGEAARVAGLPRGEGLASAMDPRALDIRSAAMGRYAPLRPTRRRRPRDDPG